jgi:two-component system sensor histidine kinase YesM
MPKTQEYLRTGEDLNADKYVADSNEYFYAFYYPIYDGTEGSSEQLGMCVFILEPWRIDGTLKNILNSSAVAMQLSDSNKLDLSFHTFGGISPELTMQDLKTDKDFVYREGNWQNGLRIAIAVSVSGNTAGSVEVRQMIMGASIIILLLLAIIVVFSYSQMAKPIHTIERFIGN